MKVKGKLEVKHSFAILTLDTMSAKRMLMKRLVQCELLVTFIFFTQRFYFAEVKPKTVNKFNELKQNLA